MKQIYLIITMIVIILILGIVIVVVKITKPKEIKSISYLRYSYSTGNAMNSSVVYEVKCENECILKIKPNNVSKIFTKTYTISDDDINKLIEIINTNKVYEWDGYNKSDRLVMDGNSFSFNLKTKEGTEIDAHGYMKWPKNYQKVRGEFNSLFDKYIKED